MWLDVVFGAVAGLLPPVLSWNQNFIFIMMNMTAEEV